MRRERAGDRVLVALVGLVALAAGGYGLARSLGAFGRRQSEAPLLAEELRRWLAGNAGWVGGVATFVALVLAWAGWRWLRRQLVASPATLRQVRVTSSGEGRTRVDARAVTEAVERDLEGGPDVRRARARLVGYERAPSLDLAVDLAAAADPRAARRHVEDYVLPRARTALERDDLTASLLLRLGDPADRVLR